MQLTWFDGNSWLIEIGNKRILLDPWLVGSLIFSNQSWLFKGEKLTQYPIPDNIDLILLSQGLEDHAHPDTLKQLNHNIPVLGSPNAAKVCENLGYKKVNSLAHGADFTLDEQVYIKAIPGSPIGLNLVENGYIIRDLNTGESIYYEPHGFHSPSLKDEQLIDVIITPLINLNLFLLGSFIKGQKSALEVCKSLKPKFILPTAAGGEVEYHGLLKFILSEEGTINDFRSLLTNNNINNIQVIEQTPGELIKI